MAWTQRGPRNGRRRLSEKLRQRVLSRYPACAPGLPGICTGVSTQVHHVIDAADHDPNDPNIDNEDGLVGACAPCHRRHSAQISQRRSVAKQNEWKRKPERHPGILPD